MHAMSPQRQQRLRAMGITPWVLRRSVIGDLRDAPAPHDLAADAVEAPRCVVVLPADAAPAELDLLGRALTAAGATVARAARLTVRDGSLREVPAATAFLVLGEAQAHALGRELSAQQQQRARIILADEPSRLRADGAAKRRFWHALRELRRALRGQDD